MDIDMPKPTTEATLEGTSTIVAEVKYANSAEFLRKERTEKGIKIAGLPVNYNRVVLHEYVQTFGQIVEKIEQDHRKQSTKEKRLLYALYRFKDQESVDKIKANLVHTLPFGKVTIRGWPRPISESKTLLPNTVIKAKLRTIESFNTSLTFGEQFDAFLTRITPGSDSLCKYNSLCADVEAVVRCRLHDCSVIPFGSTVTGLALKDSDVDIFIDVGRTRIPPDSIIRTVKQQIYNAQHLFNNIILINAKTPIVRCIHCKTGLKSDISCKNALGVMNTRLIKYYVSLDPRIRPLLILIRYWANYFDLAGTVYLLSNYALTLKVIFYLQQMNNPIIPTVASLQASCNKKVFIDLWEASFDDTPVRVDLDSDNRSVMDLARGFFDYYSNFNYAENIICPLLGKIVPKSDLKDLSTIPLEMKAFITHGSLEDTRKFVSDYSICVQDPFVLSHNVTRALRKTYLQDLMIPSYSLASQALKEVNDTSHLLPKLFDEKNRVLTALTQSTKIKPINIKLLPSKIVGFQSKELVGKSVNAWFLDSYKFLIFMFEKMFGLEIWYNNWTGLDESESSPQKISKLDSNADNCLPSFDQANPVTIHCSGCYDIMDSRNVLRKKLLEPISPFKKELLITEQVIAQLRLQESTCSTINFMCTFSPVLEPPQIGIEISNRGTKERKYKKWSLFMDEIIYKWYTIYFMDFKHWIVEGGNVES